MNLAKHYSPNESEPAIYAMWEKSGVFNPSGVGEPYSVVMPPLNANGNMHVGHALGCGIQDILVRYHRMKGYNAVYLPGVDHAGFETWVVYERTLEEQGKTRFDFNRDQLYSQVWDFVDKFRGDIELQVRALGAGVSWQNSTFTLDEKVVKTVNNTFKKMWDDGLVYRGKRMVNFCTTHQTSFSDIEVNYKNEKGKLYKIAYPTLSSIGEIVVATTRPETMLGDVAVAVNPNDDRYKHLIGTNVQLPLTDREIPIIADSYVDMAYGTGALKITPAHDLNDYEIGQRHNLEQIQVIDFNGKMVNVPPQFMGLTIGEARLKVINSLKLAESYRGESDIEHSVGHCYKCGTVIEPLIKDQWFVNVKPLVKPALEVLKSGKMNFTPKSKADVLCNYLENMHDWNISRQIPWGIPIPAFYNRNDLDDWIFDERVDQKSVIVNNTTYIRDEDTFDTWFSSSQWPFITTDYLANGDLSQFYPLNIMETGGDILFAWVSRMIMLGIYCTGEVPFKDVYLHGLVLDSKGIKMSKSKGNVINPMQYVAEYGSDALRMGVVANRSASQNQAFGPEKVITYRNYCNKLWNVARFIMTIVGDVKVNKQPTPQTLAEHWIVDRLNIASMQIENQIKSYRFAEAVETAYHVLWDDVADWFIEVSKVENNPSVCAYVLDTILKITHPIAPFVTETIWQALPWQDSLLASEDWPELQEVASISSAQFERLKQLVTEARYVISELPGNEKYSILYMDDSLVADNANIITKITPVKSVDHVDQARGLRLASSGRDAWLDVDADILYEYQTNLEKRLVEARNDLKTIELRLANDNYIAKAPEHLVQESRETLAKKQRLVDRLSLELQVVSENTIN